jgi:hypothetical protein
MERFVGAYIGAGTWHDSTGASSGYRVRQTTKDGFEVAFRHDCDDGSVVDGRVTMRWIAPALFHVDVSGNAVGKGYVFDDVCHYHMRAGDAFVEVGYRSVADGMDVSGSSNPHDRSGTESRRAVYCLCSPGSRSVSTCRYGRGGTDPEIVARRCQDVCSSRTDCTGRAPLSRESPRRH